MTPTEARAKLAEFCKDETRSPFALLGAVMSFIKLYGNDDERRTLAKIEASLMTLLKPGS